MTLNALANSSSDLHAITFFARRSQANSLEVRYRPNATISVPAITINPLSLDQQSLFCPIEQWSDQSLKPGTEPFHARPQSFAGPPLKLRSSYLPTPITGLSSKADL